MELQAEKNIDGMQNGIQMILAFYQSNYLTQLVNQIFLISFRASFHLSINKNSQFMMLVKSYMRWKYLWKSLLVGATQ